MHRGATASRELVPVVIHFLLALAIDDQRNRLGKLELGAAVQCGELLSVERELDDHDGPGFLAVVFFAGRGVTLDMGDFGVAAKGGNVVVGGLFGLVLEPEAGGNFVDGHCGLLCYSHEFSTSTFKRGSIDF